jgi:hypothetical protein
LDSAARDDFADLLDVLHRLLGVQPVMMDAWMDLTILVREAIDAGSLDVLALQIEDATARLVGGAERIRLLAVEYRGE